jgi:hypothetical protein
MLVDVISRPWAWRGAMIAAAVVAFGTAGCACQASAPAPPPEPLAIVLLADRTVTIDGMPMESLAEFRLVLKARIGERRVQAKQQHPAPAPAKAGIPPGPPEVTIEIPSPEQTTYQELSRVLLACDSALVERLEIQGIPYLMSLTAGCLLHSTPAKQPPLKWLPLQVTGQDDLAQVRVHATELQGRGVSVNAHGKTPMALVIQILCLVRENGGQFGFALPFPEDDDDLPPAVVLTERKVNAEGRLLAEVAYGAEAGNRIGDSNVSRDRLGEGPWPSTMRGFFGIDLPEEISSAVFVIDRSGSMTDTIDYVKFGLKMSIGELSEETEFHVLFYSSGPPVEMSVRGLVPATERNKMMAYEFIDSVTAEGETDPCEALRRAFACKPDVICLLTDGEFDKSVPGLVKSLNADGKVKVHTVAFLYRQGERELQKIAAQNNGTYKFISEEALGEMAQ